MELKPLDPEVILRMLVGHKDIITPMAQEREKFYQSQSCPHCGGATFTKHATSADIFRGNDPLARYQLICQDCDCLFDPHSGLVLKLGNRAKAWGPPVPLIDGPED